MQLEVLPTPPDLDEDGDGDEPYTGVYMSINEDDGTHRGASYNVTSTDDDAVAAAIVMCIQGLAAMRGPGLQLALAKRLTIREG